MGEKRRKHTRSKPSGELFSRSADVIKTVDIYSLYSEYGRTPATFRAPIVKNIATSLIADPTQVSSFWTEMSSNAEQGTQLLNELRPSIKAASLEADYSKLNEKQLTSLFGLINPASEADTQSVVQSMLNDIWTGLVGGTMDKSFRQLSSDQLDKKLMLGQIGIKELQKTQDRIVGFLYTLTQGVLKTQDRHLYEKLNEFLAYETPILNPSQTHTGLVAAAGFSINPTTMVKAITVDYAHSLLETSLRPGNDTSLENTKKTHTHPATRSYLAAAKKYHPNGAKALIEYFKNRKGIVGTVGYVDVDMDAAHYYTQPLQYPENLVQNMNNPLWAEYLTYYSSYAIENGMFRNPVEILYLPDRSVRHIVTENGEPFREARETIRLVSEKKQEVAHPLILETFLNNLHPRLLDETSVKLEENNAQKRTDLVQFPSHGISKMGLTIDIDRKTYPSIEASSFHIDQTGSVIEIAIGNTTLHLGLNNRYELCAQDGSPLHLDLGARIWWNHVILPQLHHYICADPEETEGYIVGVELEAGETPQAATRRVRTNRIGHFRTLGSKKDGTDRQYTAKHAEDLEKNYRFLMPHTEILSLKERNKNKKPGDGQIETYVLPVEKELTKTPVFRLPHAYDDSSEILKSDPNLNQA